jgi:predicted signal transduction protein with EAL and GGDEF domain
VHEVKVDRTFVQGIANSAVDAAIVRAVVDLADAMSITAVAEGVETADQVDRLKLAGCRVGQGFYFSKPLGAAAFGELLTRHFTGADDAAGPGGPVPGGDAVTTPASAAVLPARAARAHVSEHAVGALAVRLGERVAHHHLRVAG